MGAQDNGIGDGDRVTTRLGPVIAAAATKSGKLVKPTKDVDVDALLERGAALLTGEAVAEAREQWARAAEEAERRSGQERRLLEQLRALHRSYSQLRNRRWCDSDAGRPVVAQVETLHDAIDRLHGAKRTDSDYDLMRLIRQGWTQGDYVNAARTAARPISDEIPAVLVEISSEERRRRIAGGELPKFFFRFDRKFWAPNGYAGRPEVKRIVGALIGLRARAGATINAEHRDQQALLEQFPLPITTNGDSGGTASAAQVVMPSTAFWFTDPVEFAVFVKNMVNQVPGQTRVRPWSGVVHLRVSCVEALKAAKKVYEVLGVVGDLARLYPEDDRGRRRIALACAERQVTFDPDSATVCASPFKALIAHIQAADAHLRDVKERVIREIETQVAAPETSKEKRTQLQEETADLKGRTLDWYVGLGAFNRNVRGERPRHGRGRYVQKSEAAAAVPAADAAKPGRPAAKGTAGARRPKPKPKPKTAPTTS